MENTSMLEISSGTARRTRFFLMVFLTVALFMSAGAILAPYFSAIEPESLAYLVLFLTFIVFGVILCTSHVTHSVFESADGTFLRIKINGTEKILPLSEIESVDLCNVTRGDANALPINTLRVKVKPQSSFNIFSLYKIFLFTPNEAYFQSAFFRQFPVSICGKDIKNLKDFKETLTPKSFKKKISSREFWKRRWFTIFPFQLLLALLAMWLIFLYSDLVWLLVYLLFFMLTCLFGFYRISDRVFESSDGMFLCASYHGTRVIKTLPLADIESVDIIRCRSLYGAFNALRVMVKHKSLVCGFSFGEIFLFTPNEAYFNSALFRQFQLPDGIKNLEEFRAWFLRQKAW